MGSFSEVVLSFDFARETPDEVLAAFAALAVPDLREGAPSLPSPVVETGVFEPDLLDVDYWEGESNPSGTAPWQHDWAPWVSSSMSVYTTPHGRLVWSETGTWNLDCRFSWKTGPEEVSAALSWLAPFVDTKYANGKVLVGYVHFEYAPRPHLFWIEADRWELDDLNPNDDWMWGG